MEQKLKVFLSSAQYLDEFKTERDALPLLFEKPPLSSFCYLWKIEDLASPEKVEGYYKGNVRNSNMLLILLGENLRPAVRDEFKEAVQTMV